MGDSISKRKETKTTINSTIQKANQKNNQSNPTTILKSTTSSPPTAYSKPITPEQVPELPMETNLDEFYQQYKEANEDKILAQGVEKFCVDLELNPTDFLVLAIAWKFKATQMCQFTKEQFYDGCKALKASNQMELKSALPSIAKELRENKAKFKDLYYFTYNFGLDHDKSQRVQPIEMAIALWECVFQGADQYPKLLQEWVNFLREAAVKTISKDTWNMFYHLIQTVSPDLSNYDSGDAWPGLFDDFSEYKKSKMTQTA